MRHVTAIAVATMLTSEAVGQEAGAADGTDTLTETPVFLQVLDASNVTLEEFRWLSRPIVILADTPADPTFEEQLSLLLERPEELVERDVVVIVDTDPKVRTDIRTKLRPRGFMLTLIGKNGEINLRKPFPWNVREITHAIDKWPLRQKEIRDTKAAANEGTE